MIYGALAGVMAVIIMMLSAKGKAKEKKISIEDFKSLSQDSYEVYFLGSQSKYNNLKIPNIKLIDNKTLKSIRRAKTAEDLPFDIGKEVIIVYDDLTKLYYFGPVSSKHGIKYRVLGSYKTLVYEFK